MVPVEKQGDPVMHRVPVTVLSFCCNCTVVLPDSIIRSLRHEPFQLPETLIEAESPLPSETTPSSPPPPQATMAINPKAMKLIRHRLCNFSINLLLTLFMT